jgi:DNA-binding protein HU-beta
MVGISEIAKNVAGKAKVSQKAAENVLREALKDIVKNVDKGKKVRLAGFGIFSRKKTKARKAKNPRTKAIINVPAKNKFHFSASSNVKYK